MKPKLKSTRILRAESTNKLKSRSNKKLAALGLYSLLWNRDEAEIKLNLIRCWIVIVISALNSLWPYLTEMKLTN